MAFWRGRSHKRVLVTGGTGFVGCHSVAALVSGGHQVRLLVRSRDQVARSLSPLGVADVESVVGDVTVPQSVEEAMAGCEAVLHAAAVYSLGPRAARRVRETNVRAAEIVLGAATRTWETATVPSSRARKAAVPCAAAVRSSMSGTWRRYTPRSWSPAGARAAS